MRKKVVEYLQEKDYEGSLKNLPTAETEVLEISEKVNLSVIAVADDRV